MAEKQQSEWWTEIVLLCFGLAIIGYFINLHIVLPLKAEYESGLLWWNLGKTFAVLALIGGIVRLSVWAYKSREERKSKKSDLECLKRQANELLEEAQEKARESPDYFNTVSKELSELSQRILRWPKGYLAKQCSELFEKVETEHQRLQTHCQNVLKEKEIARQKAMQQDRDNTQKVFEHFKEQGSTETIPARFAELDSKVIERAKEWYKTSWARQLAVDREIASQEEHWKQACLFVWKHHALPSNYANMSENEKQLYGEAQQLHEQGILAEEIENLRETELEQQRKQFLRQEDYLQIADSVESGQQRAEALASKEFFLASELTKSEREFLAKFYGFKPHKVSNFGDGFTGVLYRGERSNESANHFCTKHLFARLHPTAKIEHKDWWGNEIDVLFNKGNHKCAVEIETGSNKPDYIAEKVAKLHKPYERIILVVPRDKLSKYRIHHDGQKLFVLTAKQAKENLLEWLSQNAPRKTKVQTQNTDDKAKAKQPAHLGIIS